MDTTTRPAPAATPAATSPTDVEPGLDELARAHMSPILGRYFERTWDHGEGHRLFDAEGRGYLDFATGIATTALGHRHPAVSRAIHEQVDRLLHVCNAVGYVEPVTRLATALAETLPDPLDTVFLANSGAEAVEAALKMARRVTGRPAFIAFSDAFHGRTMGAVAVTSSSINYRTGYEPLLPGVYQAPFPNAYRDFGGDEAAATAGAIAGLQRIFERQVPPSSVAAILIEPVQGEGGFNPAPVAFLQYLRAICDEHGILLITDEIQCGLGRTGRMWAFEHAGIVPDVVCVAKAIANGLPLSAIVSRRELQERWGVGAHGTTFGGNPVSCAAALAVLETIRGQELAANAAARGAELSAGLRAIMQEDERIGDVRGPGLMVGVEFVLDRATRRPDGATAEAMLQACADAGLLVLACGAQHQVVRFLPPLDVTSDEIREALGIFRSCLRALPSAEQAGI